VFNVVGLIVLIIAILGSGGMVAVLAWLGFRIRRLEEGVGAADRRQLLDEVDRLREEVEAARRETRALEEQVDFMERLLGAGEEAGEDEEASA